MPPRSQGRTSAARVAGVYLFAGVVWILLSDLALAAMVPDPQLLSTLQTLKGWLFTAASAALIAWLVRRELRKVTSTEARFEALAGQGIVGTFAVRGGRLVHANGRLEEIFGYGQGELLGQRVLALVAEEEHRRMRADAPHPDTEAPRIIRRRFDGVRRDGSRIPVEVHGRVIDWDGAPALAGILMDLSDQMRLQDRLRQAGRLETLGEVTGSVAHDFNNFLTGILTNLDLALEELDEDPANAQASLQVVRDAASRAAALTGQLLQFSRARTFQHRPLDVNEHIRRLATFLRTLADDGRVLDLELQEDLPQVLLDPMALDQLLMNLFVNAKQATPAGGRIVIRTRSRLSSAGSDVFVEVQDDGVGMPREVLDRIFEPFFTTKERGTGLGLATVRGIMDEARGHFTVDSAPGAGTTVRLLFPEATHLLRREAAEVPLPAPRAAPSRDARVLIVDRDPAVARVIAVALRRAGYQTFEARGAREALRLAGAGGGVFHLAVLDEEVPEVADGSLPEELMEAQPEARVLLTSATGGEGYAGEGSPIPFRLAKPFSVEQLLAAASLALDVGAPGPRGRVHGA